MKHLPSGAGGQAVIDTNGKYRFKIYFPEVREILLYSTGVSQLDNAKYRLFARNFGSFLSIIISLLSPHPRIAMACAPSPSLRLERVFETAYSPEFKKFSS